MVVPLYIAIAEVTGVMPAIPANLRGGALVLVIAFHHIARAHDDFTNLSVSKELSVLSHYRNTHKRRGPTAASQPNLGRDVAVHEMIFGLKNRAKH